MISKVNPKFWKYYDALPKEAQEQARKAYRLFRQNPSHISLHFKPIKARKNLYSVRVTDSYRVLGWMTGDNEITWFWIGTHDEYNTLIK